MCGVHATYITHILKFSCIYTVFGSYISKIKKYRLWFLQSFILSTLCDILAW